MTICPNGILIHTHLKIPVTDDKYSFKRVQAMKKIVILALFLCSTLSHAWEQRPPLPLPACQVHAPYGFPQTAGVQPICRQAYLVGYDAAVKLPRYVTYELLPKNAVGCIARTNAFVQDQSIKNGPHPDD